MLNGNEGFIIVERKIFEYDCRRIRQISIDFTQVKRTDGEIL
jgi:hypothetical protein